MKRTATLSLRRLGPLWTVMFGFGLAALWIAPLASRAAEKAPGVAAVVNMDALDNVQKLAVGDRLSFRIIEDKDEPKPLTISDTGELEVPYLGRFPALDKTCQALAKELKAELEKKYYFKATVVIGVDQFSKNRGKVYLVGQVRASGPQEIPSDETLTLTKAILRCGGFTDFADKKHVKVTRKRAAGQEPESFTVDVSEIIEKGKMDKDLPLQSGDLIFVPGRLINL
jgi:polysaccharide export outer membrane protein